MTDTDTDTGSMPEMAAQHEQINARREFAKDMLLAELSDEDIEAWHAGDVTPHVEGLMNSLKVKELQVWGSRTGREPLSVILDLHDDA